MSTLITTTVHLRAGTPEEYLVQVSANVSIFAGRYRIDKLEVTGEGAAVIAPADLDDAYEQIIEAARPRGLADPGRRERGSIVLPILIMALFLAVVSAILVSSPRLLKQKVTAPPSSPSIISYTSPHRLGGGRYSPVLLTIKHDNHWFITGQLGETVVFHHPDCPCGGAPKGLTPSVSPSSGIPKR